RDAARDEIVHQHPKVRLVASRPPGLAALHPKRSVDARKKPLGGSLLVAGSAIDLTGEEESLEALRFQRRLQIAGVEVVILDRVARPHDVRPLEAPDRVHQLELHVERQAGGDAVWVDFVAAEAFGLKKQLMAGFACEAVDLVLDGRTIARTHALDRAGIHRRTVQGTANDFVSRL